VSDYLGTPTHAFDEQGALVWERELDCYGKVRKETGIKGLVPHLYQGQYFDEDCSLAYNRFRYYDPESGNYISQDPIGLNGGTALYGYVHDTNTWVDVFGLMPWPDLKSTGVGHHTIPKTHASKIDGLEKLGTQHNSPTWYPNNPANTGILHQEMHNKLTEAGIPRKGTFNGTADDLISKTKAAYTGIETKGYVKIPKTGEIIATKVTPLEAVDEVLAWNEKQKAKGGGCH
jgi:RHS repeat-associated protein